MILKPARAFRGAFRVPGDKSITHRAFLLGAIAEGVSTVAGASTGGDCLSTRRCLEDLGIRFKDRDGVIHVEGGSFRPPARPLDCGNSGTTLRLLMGMLAGSSFETTLTGDASLQRRPMERVAAPLRLMNADIETTEGRPPVRVRGARLTGARLRPEAASAQIKSAILLAGLWAQGRTSVEEPVATRDHTERMLPLFGGRIDRDAGLLSVEGPQTLCAARVDVPGDPSSAAPFVVAALLSRDSEVVLDNILLNPHRVRYLDVLREMGADITIEPASEAGWEPTGRIVARSSDLRGFHVSPEVVPAVVDELPILAVAGAFAAGTFSVRGAAELRVKESDRIRSMALGLGAMGARISENEDGFTIEGGAPLRGTVVDSFGDHRIAMALSVAALGATGETEVQDAEVVSISLPEFFTNLRAGTNS